MNRMRALAVAAILAGALPGCGEDQPNQPAEEKDLGAEFGKNTADMMKSANSGMDLKGAQKTNARKGTAR